MGLLGKSKSKGDLSLADTDHSRVDSGSSDSTGATFMPPSGDESSCEATQTPPNSTSLPNKKKAQVKATIAVKASSEQQICHSASPKVLKTSPEERLATLLTKNPSAWSVKDVCDWLDVLSMGQYRKRFVHHAVSGVVLSKLDDNILKNDLGVRNLGHREGILRAVADLLRRPPLRQGSEGKSLSGTAVIAVPTVAEKDIAAIRIQESRSRLLHDLEKAEARVVQKKVASEEAHRMSELAEKEVERIRSLLNKMEGCHKGKSSLSPSSSLSEGGSSTVIKKREEDTLHNSTFLQRLQADLESRSSRSKMAKSKKADKFSVHGGANGKEEQSSSLEVSLVLIRSSLPDKESPLFKALMLHDQHGVKNGETASTDPQQESQEKCLEGEDSKLCNALNEATAIFAASINLPATDVEAVKSITDVQKKAQRLAAAVRSMLFMARLQQDMVIREEKKKELRQRWAQQRINSIAQREQRDMAEAFKQFTALGWPKEAAQGTGSGHDLLGALIKRAQLMQEAKSNGKAVDWEHCKDDGLVSLSLLTNTTPDALAVDPGVQDNGSTGASVSSVSTAPIDPTVAADAATSMQIPNTQGSAVLQATIALLATCRREELIRLEATNGPKRLLAVYRAVKSQQFLKETQADLAARTAKRTEAEAAHMPPRGKVFGKKEREEFLQRLALNAEKREKNRQEAIAAVRSIVLLLILIIKNKIFDFLLRRFSKKKRQSQNHFPSQHEMLLQKQTMRQKMTLCLMCLLPFNLLEVVLNE